MKTFKEFLIEKITHGISGKDANIDTIKSLLEKKCSKVLTSYKSGGSILYRGIKSEGSVYMRVQGITDKTNNDFVLGKSRDNRKSVDISKKDNELFHEAFLKLGLKATRKNSIFTTSVKKSAKDWGILFIIFPFDTANITWIDLDKLEYEYPYYVLQGISDDFPYRKDKKQIKMDYVTHEIKNKLNPIKDNLSRALKHKNVEVLVNGDYYGIKVDSKLWTKDIKPWLKA